MRKLVWLLTAILIFSLAISCAPAPLRTPPPALPTPAEEPGKIQPTPPAGTTEPVSPPTQEKPKENLIDLAYMQAVAHQYSDDADPEPEGAEIYLLCYDSKSNLIFLDEHKHITLQVSIEILASKRGEYPPPLHRVRL